MAAFELVSASIEDTKYKFDLAPAHNALSSLWLLNFEPVGYVEWIAQTRDSLTVDQFSLNNELCWPASTLLRGQNWESFPAWLEDLETRDPVWLAKYDLKNLLERTHLYSEEFTDKTAVDLYNEQDLYVNVVKTLYQYTNWDFVQKDVEKEHQTLTSPESMIARKEKMMTHFSMMWELYLSQEWEQNLSLMEDSVAAYSSIDLQNLSEEEALARVTGSCSDGLKQWMSWIPSINEIICFPNPHIFSYSLIIDRTPDIAFVAMSMNLPSNARVHPSGLNRSLLKNSLNALADDTRLRIISLLAAEPGLTAKEIRERLDLSQSAASRHINQLAGSGFLWSQKVDGVYQYSTSDKPLDSLHQALKELFGAK